MTGQDRRVRGYDLIGDIHGCALTLRALLEQMDYRRVNGVYQHPHRQVIFVGDIIDRGPRIREALHIVRDMVERGSAQMVMGNHEYNALGYCTRARPGSAHQFLRDHNPRHNRLIRETLAAFEDHAQEWNEFLEWFYQIPLFLDFGHFRVVHACWDAELIEAFRARHPDGCIDEDFLHASVVAGSFAGRVMDRLLRGTDLPLPEGLTITGRDGYTRKFFRTKFWAENPATYGDVVFQPDGLPRDLMQRPLSPQEQRKLLRYGADEPPVFFGHYWMAGTPRLLRPNVACLDYSAVKYGKLVAYRLDDETVLRPDKFVWQEVRREHEPERRGGL